MMPTWNKVHIERHGRWIYRIEDERHWDADFPGLGHWTNERWWKIKPKVRQQGKIARQHRRSTKNRPVHRRPGASPASHRWPLPGMLRIAYPQFIHYEFYVPIDAERTKLRRGHGASSRPASPGRRFFATYLGGIRWLFHGNFSGQDDWMVAIDRRPARAPLPPRRLAAGVAPPGRGGQPVRAVPRLRTVDEAEGRDASPSPLDRRRAAWSPPARHGYHVITLGEATQPDARVPPRRRARLLGMDRLRPDRSAVRRRPMLPPRRPAAVRQVRQVARSAVRAGATSRRRWSSCSTRSAIERADLVCNSWGGTIAIALAAEHPERVRSLVVTGSMPVFYGPLAAAARGWAPRPHRPRPLLRRRRSDARQDARPDRAPRVVRRRR